HHTHTHTHTHTHIRPSHTRLGNARPAHHTCGHKLYMHYTHTYTHTHTHIHIHTHTYTHRGGFSYRRYRRSPRAPLRGGRTKLRPAKKKKKNFFFFFAGHSFFCAPFYISNQYFDIKKKSNIRVKLAKNRKRKGYVRPCCWQNMQPQ